MPLLTTAGSLQGAFRPGYKPNAVAFNGSTYFTRGAGLTGAANSKSLTASYWVNPGLATTVQYLVAAATTVGGSTARTRILMGSAGGTNFVGQAAATGGTNLVAINTSPLALSGWKHIMMSFDASDTGKRHLYVNGASDINVSAYTDAVIDYVWSDWSLGARADGATPFTGYLADFLMWPGTYVDLSVTANQRLFLTPLIRAQNPDIAIAALGSPIVGFCGTTSTWHQNTKGYGGAFTTAAGALTTAPPPPWG